jgi:membrane protease YdiL (CAAX protease family)
MLSELKSDWLDMWRSDADRMAIQVLLSSAVLVIVFTLWGKPGFLKLHMPSLGRALGVADGGPTYALIPYLYWAVTSVVLRIAVPVALIILWLRKRPADFGFRLRGVTSHAWIYLALFAVMVPVVTAVSFTPAFQAKYPMYFSPAGGWSHFTVYQLAYGVQFLGVEAFFRGYITFGLYPRLGYLSLFVMVIPYSMVHFGKPPLEVFVAIPAGLLLGYLALKSRTWILGALLHWGVAITMDLLAIAHRGGVGGPAGPG